MKNHVKTAARDGNIVRGIHLTFPAPTIIEVLSRAELDFVYLDGEHGRFDWADVETACITAERHGLTTIARVPDPSPATITRFLDRGVLGVVVPHLESPQDVERVVQSCYYGPLGARSFGAGRPEYGQRGDRPAFMQECNETVSLCVMIESVAALKCAGELATVPGVDYLSFGLLDLAQSMGHPGNPRHPSVVAAVTEATARIHAAGKRVREDFMNFAWINDALLAGARYYLDASDKARQSRAA